MEANLETHTLPSGSISPEEVLCQCFIASKMPNKGFFCFGWTLFMVLKKIMSEACSRSAGS